MRRLIRRIARQRRSLPGSPHVERDEPVDHRVDLLRHFQRQEMPGADGLGRDQLRAQRRKAIQIREPMGRFDVEHRHPARLGARARLPSPNSGLKIWPAILKSS